MTNFDDIRPYHDAEVRPVLDRLLQDPALLAAVAGLKLGAWHKPLLPLLNPLLRALLRRQLRGVDTVAGLQHIVKRYMDAMIEAHTSAFTVSGLDALDSAKSYLFMSNHRDIALDPAFVNYALYHNDHDTVRIAIGDNLLSKPYVSDLMRLNKSFIVNRSATGPRAILAAYKNLSGYIRHSIEVDGNPIWIAQREGRAKDGFDRTEPAIIKMLAIAQRKPEEEFSAYINALHIVPVSISYELDPCDAAKARELAIVAAEGEYKKAENEDVESIALGIRGEKGHVHVAFGEPLVGEFADAVAVAAAIDRQVIGNYVLHPTNFFAWRRLHGSYPEGCYGAQQTPFAADALREQERQFNARIDAMPAAQRPYALSIYANIITAKQQLAATSP